MAVLVVLLLLFCSFSVYLFVFVPHREAVSFGWVTLDETDPNFMNYSELHDKFSEPSFLQNYTVTELNSGNAYLEIIPKSNENVVITLFQDQDGNLSFATHGYVLTGAFGKMESSKEIKNEMREEQTVVLEYIGQSALVDKIEIEDYSYAAEPRFDLVLYFFSFTALIILLVFMMIFRQGWLVANVKLIGTNVPLFFGVVSLYFAISFGLMCAWVTLASVLWDVWLICWTVPVTFLIVGTYLIIAETKALAQ